VSTDSYLVTLVEQKLGRAATNQSDQNVYNTQFIDHFPVGLSIQAIIIILLKRFSSKLSYSFVGILSRGFRIQSTVEKVQVGRGRYLRACRTDAIS
jgi:hypothetical protein